MYHENSFTVEIREDLTILDFSEVECASCLVLTELVNFISRQSKSSRTDVPIEVHNASSSVTSSIKYLQLDGCSIVTNTSFVDQILMLQKHILCTFLNTRRLVLRHDI